MLTRVERLLPRRVSGGPVAFTRVMLGIALAILSLENSAALHSLAQPGKLTYPFLEWVSPPPNWLSYVVLIVGLVSAVTLVIGLLPHIMALVGGASCVVTLGTDQQFYSSHLVLLTLLLMFLSFAESDRRWGCSTRRHYTDNHHANHNAPLWPQLLMMTQVSACYLFAGLSKVQPTFLSGEPLGGWMWPDLPRVAFVALAWLTVVSEVGLAVALWVPKLRVLAAVVGVGLHVSIVLFLADQTLALVAFSLTTLSTYPLFLTRPRLGLLDAPAAATLQVSRNPGT